MNSVKVLLVEDDEKLRSTVCDYLTLNGFSVITAESGEKALDIFYKNMNSINIVLLDIMLPNIDGFEVLREIRKFSCVPVIIISAREAEEDQLSGFRLGADNYLTKPFLLSVMKEHINSILSRVNPPDERVITVGEMTVDKKSRKVLLSGEEIELTPKEFDVLSFFSENIGTVFSRDSILDKVWGVDYYGDCRTVDTIIKQLRKKMGDECQYIKSVYGVGYKFAIPEK